MNVMEVNNVISELFKEFSDISLSIHIPHLDYSFNLNENTPFPAASVIKLLSFSCIINLEANENIDLNTIIDIGIPSKLTNDRFENSGVLAYIDTSCKFSLNDLTALMMLVSDNVAADIVSDFIGFSELNRYAKKIGLVSTVYNCKLSESSKLSEHGINEI